MGEQRDPQEPQQIDLPQETDHPQEITVSGQELVGYFDSEKFTTPFRIVAGSQRKVREYATEGGFMIMRGLTTPTKRIVHATSITDEETTLSDEDILSLDEIERSGQFMLAQLHFHPFSQFAPADAFKPSLEDLQSLSSTQREIALDHGYQAASPLSLISHIRDHQHVEILLIQQPPTRPPTEALMDLCAEDVSSCERPAEIIETLQGYGYRAGIMRFGRNGFRNQDRELIGASGFTMTYNPLAKSSSVS